MALVAVLALFVGAAAALHLALRHAPFGFLAEALIASVLIAQNSLWRHVARVADGLERDGLAGGRRQVSMIVGRDPETLDEAGVARAAIESTAENFSDGVVAPAFFFALLGLPGLVAYKVINTADSMIGHMSERHRAFGWAAARLDDVVNLAPARLSGLLLGLAAPLAGGFDRQQPPRHAPRRWAPQVAECRLAGSRDGGRAGVALAGPRTYGGRLTNDPFLNAAGRTAATADDIRRALRVMVGGAALLWLLV